MDNYKFNVNQYNLDKMNFKEEGGYYFQHKTGDGKVIKIYRCGSLKYPVVFRWLYKERKSDCVSLDIRYFQRIEPCIYVQSKDGIRIYDYYNNRYWFPLIKDTFNNMMDLMTPHQTHNGDYWNDICDHIMDKDDYKESKYGNDYSILDVRGKVNPFF